MFGKHDQVLGSLIVTVTKVNLSNIWTALLYTHRIAHAHVIVTAVYLWHWDSAPIESTILVSLICQLELTWAMNLKFREELSKVLLKLRSTRDCWPVNVLNVLWWYYFTLASHQRYFYWNYIFSVKLLRNSVFLVAFIRSTLFYFWNHLRYHTFWPLFRPF